jgi:hypothetical protein
MIKKAAATFAFCAGILAAGSLQAQSEADLLDVMEDAHNADLAHRSPRAPATPPGQGAGHAGPGGTFGGVIVSGLEAGVPPTETIGLNGRPGHDSGGDPPPGQCPLCGTDFQGTEAQGAAAE